MKQFVMSMKETTPNCFLLLPNCLQVLNILYDWPVKYYFDDFGKWLLGYRIELSCLYVFISTFNVYTHIRRIKV